MAAVNFTLPSLIGRVCDFAAVGIDIVCPHVYAAFCHTRDIVFAVFICEVVVNAPHAFDGFFQAHSHGCYCTWARFVGGDTAPWECAYKSFEAAHAIDGVQFVVGQKFRVIERQIQHAREYANLFGQVGVVYILGLVQGGIHPESRVVYGCQ